MRILGIDPGLHLTGYGCVDTTVTGVASGLDPVLIEAGVIRLPRVQQRAGRTSPGGRPGARPQALAARLAQLHMELTGVVAELSPEIMVVEQLFSHYKHARTSILMGHARGVVLLVAEQNGVELDELMPTEVKKAVAGNGHASKLQMQHAVRSQCGLTDLPTPDDVADALAIALCAARRLHAPAIATA